MLLVLAVPLWAQKKSTKTSTTTKMPLTHGVYDAWREIPFKALSNDGAYAACLVNPQDGDGKVIFFNLKTNRQDSVQRAADVNFTFDSRYAVFKIKPSVKEVRDLRRQKKKKEELPKDSLGFFSLDTRMVEKLPDIRSYKMPEKAGGWVAYLRDVKREVKSKDKTTKPDSTEKKGEGSKKKTPRKNSDENGYTLVVRNLVTQKETSFGYVKDYVVAKYGQGLVFSSTGSDSSQVGAGIYWYDAANDKTQQLLASKKKQKFKGFKVSEDGNQVAFLADLDTTKALKRYPKLYYWKKGDATAAVLADEQTPNVPASWIVSEHFTPDFSKDGTKLYVGLAPHPVQQDTTLLPEEIVNVEVWNWKDDVLYPQQNKQLETERKRSYQAVIDLTKRTLVPLADKQVPMVRLANEGNAPVALLVSNLPYRWSAFYDLSTYQDAYVVDVATGKRKQAVTRVKGNVDISPQAKYLFWFNLPDTSWYSYSVETEKTYRLNKGLRVSFADEEDDHPDYPSPYGLIGWTADDKQLLVYDRYDIWAFDPENRTAPVNLTRKGREEKILFRYVKLDPEERFINPDKDLLLYGFDKTTKQSGYYTLSIKTGKLTRRVFTDHQYSVAVKARDADRLLYTRESFREYPDVWTSDLAFSSTRKLTDANPQMRKYLWGSVEMVRWTSLDNIPLQGLLYKPENFDPTKKYPMIVYFYEKYTDDIHSHYAPAPIRSIINFSMYTSNGYLVFVPDIVYKVGFPGESAHNCVLPGVTSLIAKGFVDERHIGVQGHSWGGYQTAYLVTRTNMFAAAEAGAPVSNMTSAYGGIRWESGWSRMFQYERTQSRIGGTLWEKPMLYIENSPIFFADKVRTPLLMMHNDADGAVPWYQGIEYYMALRRLNKPVWLLNYNHQGHGLSQRQDKTDFAIRMMEYFDHYLKGAPMPEWMEKGVPALEKGIKHD